jgi:Spy/CpxP family protein refolding chaperone
MTAFSNKGHIMKKATTLTLAAAALLPLAAIAQTPPAPPADASAQPQQQGATFESLDTNSDGKISKTEAEANASVKAQFSSYDVNGDGFIERDEVANANKSKESPQQ